MVMKKGKVTQYCMLSFRGFRIHMSSYLKTDVYVGAFGPVLYLAKIVGSYR